MIETLRPWIGLTIGCAAVISGLRLLLRPNRYVGVGLVPATNPRTVRFFGMLILVLGVVGLGLNLLKFLSE